MEVYLSVDESRFKYEVDIWDHLPKYSGGVFIAEFEGELLKTISKSECAMQFGVIPNPGEVYKVVSKVEKVVPLPKSQNSS